MLRTSVYIVSLVSSVIVIQLELLDAVLPTMLDILTIYMNYLDHCTVLFMVLSIHLGHSDSTSHFYISHHHCILRHTCLHVSLTKKR